MFPEGFEWHKERRSNGYRYPLLSNHDEFVPASHIGMYSIFRNPKNKNVYMSEDACQKLRMKSYQKILELYKKYNPTNYADFYNVNREEINALGYNCFAEHQKIAPVAGLIECYQTEYKLRSNGKPRQAISFGINRKLLATYFENVKKAEETGTKVEIPKLKRASQKNKNIIIFGEEKIKLSKKGKKSVAIERNALYNQFKHWCMLQGVTEREGVLMALETLIQQYPTKGVAEVGNYKVETEFDKYLYIQPSQDKPRTRTIRFDAQILGLAEKIIERYNADPINICKPYMDLATYVNNATHLLNSNMDLKYRDPQLAEEKKEVERMEKHNFS